MIQPLLGMKHKHTLFSNFAKFGLITFCFNVNNIICNHKKCISSDLITCNLVGTACFVEDEIQIQKKRERKKEPCKLV